MNLFFRPLILLLLIILGNTLHARGQSEARIDSIKKPGGGVISGKVTIKGKGASGITVALRAADDNSNEPTLQKVTTDEEGNYQITNVAPGAYYVVLTAPTFVVAGEIGLVQFMPRSFGPSGKAVIIAERETVQNVDFALTPGGIITGRVTDSEGRPLIEQQIFVTPVTGKGQATRDYQSMPRFSSTDDRGIYRIFGLPKGSYLVSVGRTQDGLFVGGPRSSRNRQTFHPAVNDASRATIIEVTEGSESTNIDITVSIEPTSDTFAVSGRIVDGSTGQPIPNITLGLQMSAGSQTSSITSFDWKSNQLGEFRFQNLTPGKYSIYVETQFNSEFRADPMPIEVINQDVTGLVMKAVRGASVSGVVLFDGANAKSDRERFGQLVLHSFVERESRDGGFGRSATVNPDGSFRIGGLEAGTAHFLVGSNDGPAKGFRIVRVEREGVVQLRGIEIKDGEAVTGVRLVIRFGNGSIRGIVKVENGELPRPPRLSLWLTVPGEDAMNPLGALMQEPQVDLRGHFLIENLPAGNYEVNASVFVPSGRVSAKQQVNVTDGAVAEVTLTLNLKPN